MKNNTIPEAVISAAKERRALGSGSITLLGHLKNGDEVYSFVFDETMIIGLPELYVCDGKFVRIVKGIEAANLLSQIIKTTLH